jgi:hypothetical protein
LCAGGQASHAKGVAQRAAEKEELITPAMVYYWIDPNTMAR